MARTLPGDELMERAADDMNHGITIDAPPEEVWPWIAQIGDDRAGFYSHTFVESAAQKSMAGGEAMYHNADRIPPEFQNPQPEEGIIMDTLWLRRLFDISLVALLWWAARRVPRAVTAASAARGQRCGSRGVQPQVQK